MLADAYKPASAGQSIARHFMIGLQVHLDSCSDS